MRFTGEHHTEKICVICNMFIFTTKHLVSYLLGFRWLEKVIENGVAFMTDGCPDRHGKMACNRPYGSYRPGEEFRDYPFLPQQKDLKVIRNEMKLQEVTSSVETTLV